MFVKVTEAGLHLSKAQRVITNERGRKIEVEVLHYNNASTIIRMVSPDATHQNFITELEAKALRDCLIEALTV